MHPDSSYDTCQQSYEHWLYTTELLEGNDTHVTTPAHCACYMPYNTSDASSPCLLNNIDIVPNSTTQMSFSDHWEAPDAGLSSPTTPGATWVTVALNVSSNLTLLDGEVIQLSPPTLTYFDNQQGLLPLYTYENVTYNSSWISSQTICEPSHDYQWGFSVPGLLLFMIFTAVFSLLLWAVWFDTYRYSRVARTARDMGTYRAILDISMAMRAELPDDCDSMTNTQIKDAIRQHGAGMRMERTSLPLSRAETAKSETRSKQEIGPTKRREFPRQRKDSDGIEKVYEPFLGT